MTTEAEQVVDGGIVMHERTDRFSFEGRAHVLPVCAVFEVEDGRSERSLQRTRWQSRRLALPRACVPRYADDQLYGSEGGRAPAEDVRRVGRLTSSAVTQEERPGVPPLNRLGNGQWRLIVDAGT